MAVVSLSPARLSPVKRLPGHALPSDFFSRNTLAVAPALLGILLCRHEADGTYTVGRIVETEAYVGEDDPACHAAAGRTPRTRILYGKPGVAYVYFTYGMHHCLNVVTEREDHPAAVLLRALRPVAGLERMAERRGRADPRELTSGPARLCQALAINLEQNGVGLRGPELHLRDDGHREFRVGQGVRVGIRVGTERPWRFWVDSDPCVSRSGPLPPARREPPSRQACG